MKKLNILAVIAILLGISTFYLYDKKSVLTKEKQTIYAKNQILTGQIAELEELRASLKAEIDSLSHSFGKVVEEKKVIEKLLQKSKVKLAKTKIDFQDFKAASNTKILSLKESIQQLFRSKASLEVTIQETTQTNDLLLKEAGIDRATFDNIMSSSDDREVAFQQLTKEYRAVQQRARDLARAKDRKKVKVNLQPKAAYVKPMLATSFRVELEGRNGKVTARGKKVKNIKVSFELNEVDKANLGKQELYLVIKDETQKLITSNNQAIKVNLEGKEVTIITTLSRHVDLEENQRVRFVYDVDEKLAKGYYSVYIYTKNSLLGETSFRVE